MATEPTPKRRRGRKGGAPPVDVPRMPPVLPAPPASEEAARLRSAAWRWLSALSEGASDEPPVIDIPPEVALPTASKTAPIEADEVDDQVDEYVDEQVDKKVDERIDKRVDEQVDERIDKRVDEQVDERIDKQVDERVAERIDKRVDERVADEADEQPEPEAESSEERAAEPTTDDASEPSDLSSTDSIEPSDAEPAEPSEALADELSSEPAADAGDSAEASDEPIAARPSGAATSAGDVARAHLKGVLEALIFASEHPLALKDLTRLARADRALVKGLMTELVAEYHSRGVRLDEVAGGYVFRTSPAFAPFVREMAAKKPVRMSRAQIETLAIVAYRQPVTRPEIDEVRGVDSGAVLKSLLERDFVRILGKKDEPGRPMLYGTTPTFLEFFGLKTLSDLPTLREFTELSDDSRRAYEREMGEEPPDDVDNLGPEAGVSADNLAGAEGAFRSSKGKGEAIDDGEPAEPSADASTDRDLEESDSSRSEDASAPNASKKPSDSDEEEPPSSGTTDEVEEDEEDEDENENEDEDEGDEDEGDEDEGDEDDEDDEDEDDEDEDEDD